ncbi:MAG TPA: dihydroneopterin aldolase [Acidimicrobiales bacterium]|nr:dihydroneopterin aldolase [Acidimicrobiales bacterium]
MSDAIEIRGLRVLGTHGVLEEEKLRAQPFEVDLVLEAPLSGAADSDDVAKTIDYGPIVSSVRDLVATGHFDLLESLAGAVAQSVLSDERVEAVTVSVRKLHPPLAADVASVGVRLVRRRGETVATRQPS